MQGQYRLVLFLLIPQIFLGFPLFLLLKHHLNKILPLLHI